MKKIIYLITLLVASATIVHAETLYECADGIGAVCSDVTKKAGPYVPYPDSTNEDKTKEVEERACFNMCNTQMDGIESTLNSRHANDGKWECTLTDSVVTDTRPADDHSAATIFCECSITCVKGKVLAEEL